MPIVNVQTTTKFTAAQKRDLMEFIPQQVCANTSTLAKNIYVYINVL